MAATDSLSREKSNWMEWLRRQSFWFDIAILWLTLVRVSRRDGVAH